MIELFAKLQRYASTSMSMVIQGETGTGKELVAQAIHEASPRRHKRLVAFNCAAMTDTLLESELFGHVRGAFTGADRAHDGVFVEADGSTLLFDEVGEMSAAMQAKLLRVLENQEVRPVGTGRCRKVNVRTLFATHVDFRHAVNRGSFREDLYFRMAQVTVEIPPLRRRMDDLPVLIADILEQLERPHMKVDEKGMSALRARSWPGNVRQLRTIIEAALVESGGDRLMLERALAGTSAGAATERASGLYDDAKRDFDRRFYTALFVRFDWGALEEFLAALPGDLPSYRPPFEVSDLGVAVGIVRGDAKLPKRLATALQCREDLGTEPLGRQTRRIESVEPDGPPAPDLRVQRERQRFKGNTVASGHLAVSLLELLEQVGRNDPLARRRGGHQAKAFELAQAANRKSSRVPPVGVVRELVDAAVGGGDLGELSIDRLHGRLTLGPERDQISNAQGVGRARGDGHVVGIAPRRLDHGVERATVELIAQALADNAPDERVRLDAALAIREPLARADHVEALCVAAVQGAVHLLEDVASLPSSRKRRGQSSASTQPPGATFSARPRLSSCLSRLTRSAGSGAPRRSTSDPASTRRSVAACSISRSSEVKRSWVTSRSRVR